MNKIIHKITVKLVLLFIYCHVSFAQVEITPQGAKAADIFLQTTSDVSQTGTPALSQLIYNSNPNVTGSNANGAGYYFWNGTSWQSLDANVPTGTIVFSENHPNQPLLNAGFAMIGTTQMTTPALDVWRKISKQNAPLSTNVRFATSYNGNFFLLGNTNATRGIYDPTTDTWSAMDSTNAPNFTNPNGFAEFKDRVIANDGNNFGNSKIYNPSTNTWANLSTINANTSLSGLNSNPSSNKVLVLSETQPNKILDLAANTWTDISTTNAPILPPNSNWYVLGLNLPNKFIVSVEKNNVRNYHIYNATVNQWVTVDTTNGPNDNNWYGQWVLISSGNDTSIVFQKQIYGSSYGTIFKRFSLQQNTWFDDIAPYFSSLYNNSFFQHLGNWGDKYYFYNFLGVNIFEYNRTTNAWRIIPKHEDDVEFRTTSTFIRLCHNKIIIHGGANDYAGRYPWFDDGYMYDIPSESWKYIPSLFGVVNESSIRPVLCCNSEYLLAFFNRQYWVTYPPQQIINKSGIMQLSGPTNQTTQKTLYLYKKN